jgi:hypothetical protein
MDREKLLVCRQFVITILIGRSSAQSPACSRFRAGCASGSRSSVWSVRASSQTGDVSVTANVILAAGPSVVALAALGSTAWQQRRGLQHAREMTDLALVREMLDEAAKALHRANYARDGI